MYKRQLESLFKDVDALALIEVVLATTSMLFPAGRVLTDTATIDIDTATAGQIKTSVIDGSITTTKLGGDITTAGKALLDDASAAAQLTTLGVSAFVQTILNDADAAAVRTTIGLGTLATKDAVTDAYTITNEVATRTLDANDAAGAISATPTQGEVENIRDAVLVLADVVGTLIEDLKAKGIVA